LYLSSISPPVKTFRYVLISLSIKIVKQNTTQPEMNFFYPTIKIILTGN